MKDLITIPLLLFFSINLFGQNTETQKLETKSIFEVKVNSKAYILEEGKELDIDGEFKNPRISIKLADFKKFNAANLSFQYPSNFSFEVEKSIGYKSWTLDGNDYVIMIFDVDGQTEVKDFIDNMIPEFGEENCKTKLIESRLGEKILSGIQLYVELAGQELTIDFYKYSSSDHNSKYIAFQDALEANGASTNEALKTFKMINDSIKYE